MSLIGLRRERQRDSFGRTRPPRLGRLLAALGLVLFLIWYLSRFA